MANELEPEPAWKDASGKLHDAGLHDAILDNREADAAHSREAIAAAVKAGVPRETAQRIYAARPRQQGPI